MFLRLSTYLSTRQEPGASPLPLSHGVTGPDLNETHTAADLAALLTGTDAVFVGAGLVDLYGRSGCVGGTLWWIISL